MDVTATKEATIRQDRVVTRQANSRYRRRRDLRLPIFFTALVVVALAWVAISPGILGNQGGASSVAAIVATPTPTPTPTPSPTPSPTLGPLPACSVGDVPAIHAQPSDWARTLLDTTYMLDASYQPSDLVPVSQAGIRGTGSVRSLVIDDLKALNDAARKAGTSLVVNSAYRSYADQAITLGQLQKSQGADVALLTAARPGHSEHQLGTAIDFGSGAPWLVEHAWQYGFVLSYPAVGSPGLTCYTAEGWHYRYFGRPTAAAIHNSGMTEREWLWVNGH
jgi:D-alanyl-D-alanine carboxypeptidase